MRGRSAALLAAALAAGCGPAVLAGCGGDGGDGAAARAGWRTLRPATLARTEVAAARIGRYVYVVGGFERRSRATSAAVERYNIRLNRWRRVRPMPFGLNHTVAVAYRGRLYVHGGYRARRSLGRPTGALLRYDPARNRWRRLTSSPRRRAAHAGAVIGSHLYVAGGADATGSLRSLDVYDLEHDRWRRGPSFPGPKRNHVAGVASRGRFYVVAGRDRRNLRAVDRYDPRSRRWLRLRPIGTARGGIAAGVLRDGCVVVFGGEQLGPGGTTIRQVELFSPRTGRWRYLPSLRTPRHGLGGVALGRRVYAIEGGPHPGFSFSRALEYLDVR